MRKRQWLDAVELLGQRLTRLSPSQLGQELQKDLVFDITPWVLQRELHLGSFDTARAVMKLVEEAVRSMPLEKRGGQRRITVDEILEHLLRPATNIQSRA